MSSFLRKGRRLQDKKAKKHVKEFYKILGEMDNIAKKIKNSEEEVTEDNIEELASRHTNRNIGGMEKVILLSKLKGDD